MVSDGVAGFPAYCEHPPDVSGDVFHVSVNRLPLPPSSRSATALTSVVVGMTPRTPCSTPDVFPPDHRNVFGWTCP